MKKTLFLFLAFVLCLGLCACGEPQPTANQPTGDPNATAPMGGSQPAQPSVGDPTVDTDPTPATDPTEAPTQPSEAPTQPGGGELEYRAYPEMGYSALVGIGTCTDPVIVVAGEYEGLPVEWIESEAFDGCDWITSITVSEGTKYIGQYAFRDCTALRELILPDSLQQIDNTMLENCSSLESFCLPAKVSTQFYGLFDGCSSLSSVTVGEGSYFYRAVGNCIIYINQQMLVAGIAESEIPGDGSVPYLGSSCFSGCVDMVSFTIPEGVVFIGNFAFSSCSNLKEIYLPASLMENGINQYAFSDCASLETIHFAGTVEQWNALSKGSNWDLNTGNYTVHCTDGDLSK